MKKFLFALGFLVSLYGYSQDSTATAPKTNGKKIVDHTTYDLWKSIVSTTASKDGKWLAYEIKPQVGDGKLFLYNTETAAIDSFSRGKMPSFVYAGGGYLVYKIVPPYKVTRKAKLDKKKPDDMPKDTLAVLELATKKVVKLPNVKSFSTNDYATYVLAQLGKEKKTTPVLTKKQKRKLKKNPPIDIKSEGTTLVVWNVERNTQVKYRNVTDYTLPEKSQRAAFIVQEKAKKDSAYVYLVDATANTEKTTEYLGNKIFGINGWAKSVTMDETGKNIAFLATTDTAKTNKLYSLYLSTGKDNATNMILDTTNHTLNRKLTVSEHGKIYFSDNGNKLFFGIAPLPVKDPKDTLTEDEKYNLDIWHWSEPRIQPEQMKALDKDKKRSFITSYNLDNKQFLQIENDSMKVSQWVQGGNGDIALTFSDKPYRIMQGWESQVPADYYVTDLNTGAAKTSLLNKTLTVSLSYTGKYLIWYDPIKHDWFSRNIATGESYLITNNIDDNLFEDNNGSPDEPEPYGIMGWSKNDEYVYIYSEFEIWKVHPENKQEVVCLTKNKGGEYNTDLRNIKLNSDIKYIDDSWLLLKSFNHHNKREGFWTYSNGSITPMMVEDYHITFLGKPKESDKVFYTKMDFQTYGDLLMNDLKFKSEKRITNANPQQKDYAWGTVELVKWKSYAGQDVEGLLYKPEVMEEGKKYPMLVYFYEKNADGLHLYKSPSPSASVINFSEYVSNGYVIFVPDIHYKTGEPGQSAYDCIVSGTKSILEKGFVDEKRVALQGQSWGGYQVAYLVTRTDMFACGFAGAAVSNMTSAYGGVRWESGLLRAFQYEKGQSRIAKTLWEDREAYIRNSPLFFLDKVNTPLLLMNNDADGAVPWYQGIEMYNGLRRLQKPVWMLAYNNEGHNLTRRADQTDLSRRMLQFFNHYLKGAPMPQWMKEGVPAVDKGKVTGYGLMQPDGK